MVQDAPNISNSLNVDGKSIEEPLAIVPSKVHDKRLETSVFNSVKF